MDGISDMTFFFSVFHKNYDYGHMKSHIALLIIIIIMRIYERNWIKNTEKGLTSWVELTGIYMNYVYGVRNSLCKNKNL